MADTQGSRLPPPSPEQRRIAAKQYERAQQVIATGNFDYGIQLLMTCCKLDPANLIYRQSLRHTEKNKFKNNMRGSRLALLASSPTRAKIKSAKRAGEYVKVLEHGEEVLMRNPWDVGAQLDMAEAADALGCLDLGVWLLEQARQKDPQDVTVNRALARLYEKRGNFGQAIALWELIRKAAPTDVEAQNKGKDLAASATIARGGYESAVNAAKAPAADAPDERPRPAAEAKPERGAKPPSKDRVPVALPGADRLANEVATVRARIDKDPTVANAYLQLVEIYRRYDQLDQARAVLLEGLNATGNHFELAIQLAELDIEPFRRNLAIIEDKLRATPQDDELRKLRIRFLKEINTRELELYREKADRYPTDKSFHFELGVRLLRAGRLDEAIRELQAVRSDPRHNWRALLYLGYCFKSRNNWRLAERNFEEALRNLPGGDEASRKEILFQLASGCAEAGDLGKAVDLGFELANLDFGYKDIGRLLDEWQAKRSQADVSAE